MKQSGLIFIVCAGVALSGCGMKGPLFLPDKNASVVTRPGTSGTTTPPAQTAPAPAPGDTTPPAPSTPKPPQDKDKDKDDSQSTGSTPKS
jgi:predicted small lipoprotein YifL